ncbi:MAG: hypothetical protein JRH20_23600, partial [Deltaproteobacteria bacterium]|nr:hypothetical protein [Deltaproteobacteria bacterium]
IALPGRGGALITGVFDDHIAFGAIELVSEAAADIFVTYLDATGSARWAAHLWSPGEHWVQDVAVSRDSAYVIGGFKESLTVNETQLLGTDNSSMFILSLPLL